MKKKIKRNKIHCKICSQTIESKHRYDFVTCFCGAVSVDGGLDYLRRVGDLEDYIEMSE